MKDKESSAKKLLNKTNENKEKKFDEYAKQNWLQIKTLLYSHVPEYAEAMEEQILAFLEGAILGQQTALKFSPNLDPGLLSVILNNMALWIGNMQQVNKNKEKP